MPSPAGAAPAGPEGRRSRGWLNLRAGPAAAATVTSCRLTSPPYPPPPSLPYPAAAATDN